MSLDAAHEHIVINLSVSATSVMASGPGASCGAGGAGSSSTATAVMPVGQTWGWPLTAESTWWRRFDGKPEPGFADEDGTRTFALSEIMVIREQTGQGIAHALHD